MSKDKLIYRGKSKDVYQISAGPFAAKYRMVFTDRATGYMEHGKPVFDPGYDKVVGEIPGKGAVACGFATHFFKLLKSRGIPSHYIETTSATEMIVDPAVALSMPPEAPGFPGAAPLLNLEFTWRNNASGSFWRRYPFIKPCKNINMLVEAWTKGDSDILITMEALEATGAMTSSEIHETIKLVKSIALIVSEEFASRGLHVVDGKFEMGRLKGGDGKIMIIDEISPDVLRVCKGYAPDQNGDCSICELCTLTSFANDKRTIKIKNQIAPSDFVRLFK